MYTYPTLENTKVLGYKTTEPAIQKLFEAKRLKDEREKIYTNDTKKRIYLEDYLDSITEELNIRSQAFKYHIFEMGKLLYEIKRILPHGRFQSWIDNNFVLGRRTAYNFMKVYMACLGHPEVIEYFNPSCLYVISSPNFPKDLREALFVGAKGKVDIKKTELVKIAMKYKNGELKTTDKEVQDLLKKHRDSTIWEKYQIELKNLHKLIAHSLDNIEKLSTLHSANPFIEKEDKNKQLTRDEEGYKIVSFPIK